MTTWLPHIEDKESWLLGNHAIATTPELETTTSQRRFRLADNPDVAVWKKELPATVLEAIREAAELDDTCIISYLGRPGELRQAFLDSADVDIDAPTMGPARFHMSGQQHNRVTEAKWHFAHESLPFHAVVTVTMQSHYYGGYTVSWSVQFNTVYANSRDVPPEDAALVRTIQPDSTGMSGFVVSQYRPYEEQQASQGEWLNENIPDWIEELTAIQSETPNSRTAVESMIRLVESIDDHEIIDFPIGPTKEFLPLRFVKSNVNVEFLSELHDFHDGAPVAAEIAEHLNAIRAILSHRGIVMDQISEDAVSEALSGRPEVLDVHLKEGRRERDVDHAVAFNVLSGTIHVACALHERETSQEWEVALLKAELEGRKDEFLNFWKHHNAETLAEQIRERLSK